MEWEAVRLVVVGVEVPPQVRAAVARGLNSGGLALDDDFRETVAI